ncbi:unnamed protein product, partial [Allacma fusca]
MSMAFTGTGIIDMSSTKNGVVFPSPKPS